MDRGEKTALLAILISFTIFGIKFAAAYISDSIALKAEAFHTFADFIAALTVFVGLKLSKRKTKTFPYGLYKLENLVSIGISFVIFYTSYEIISEVFSSETSEIQNSGLAIGSLVLVTLIAFGFATYEKKVGQKIESPILIADAKHGWIDVLSNIVVLVAIISNTLGYPLDKIAALIVVVFVVKMGIQIFLDGVRVLLDASIDYETMRKVEKIIMNMPGVVELKDLTGRNSGGYKFIEASIVLKTHDLDKAHLTADRIEKETKEELHKVDRVHIHYEPIKKENIVYALPLAEDRTSINSHFGESPYFILFTFKVGSNRPYKNRVIDNPYSQVEKGKGILAAEFLVKMEVDFIVVKKNFDSKGPTYVFSSYGIEILLTEKEDPFEAIENME